MKFLASNWLRVLAIIMIAGAFASFPFAFYQLMGWVVIAASLVTAKQAREEGKFAWAWLFLLIAVVFNPISPIYLRTDIWHIVDIIAIALFIISFYTIRKK